MSAQLWSTVLQYVLNVIRYNSSELDDDLSGYDAQKNKLTAVLESRQEEQKKLNDRLEEFAKNAEVYCTNIANIQAKREECSRKVGCNFEF